ncbi:putative monovalent cation/H+ antiporter subunit B [Pyrococcus sp. NA2]|uniref:hydrogenase subunit MbhD domain-containing protein n=1 Tax=Pyrococcus sp. (strain NA2) TaxID=342949 RepID=UPI000209AA1A|nr:hydrogenase subunit MbhD domain-containing protein [Pyrococcus sp. NA2]AEC52540.1 putative monovalent cation/H+ antiporter subunit B [Pyrococcus sp. NA2]
MLGIILEVTIIGIAILLILHKDFKASLVLYALLSLLATLIMLLSYAPDVALSGIVVGGIIIGLFIFVYERVGCKPELRPSLSLAVIPLLLLLLMSEKTYNLSTYSAYIEKWSMGNLVTEILAGWRLYDSVGEALILFSAAIGFALMLREGKK